MVGHDLASSKSLGRSGTGAVLIKRFSLPSDGNLVSATPVPSAFAPSMPLSAHAHPPDGMRLLYKRWHKAKPEDIDDSSDILDFANLDALQQNQVSKSTLRWKRLASNNNGSSLSCLIAGAHDQQVVRYEVNALPGLFVYPALLSEAQQINLLDVLIHRDLSNILHKTNLHLHYHIPPPASGLSFFNCDQNAVLLPKDPSIHKQLSIRHMLNRKLRWVTLGGQYDWTEKVYPSEEPPVFPSDISDLLQSLWPDIDPQAAIVNFYSPGDTLSVHRDVSEECDRGLISISIGCDGIFIIGTDDPGQSTTLRLRSGDAIVMSGTSRFAWHAVPRILPHTCPVTLQDWPATLRSPEYEQWKGWLGCKRINLNVWSRIMPGGLFEASTVYCDTMTRRWRQNQLEKHELEQMFAEHK